MAYVDATRNQLFGFELPSAAWSQFDVSLPLIRHVDADLRISARKVGFGKLQFGQGGATITAQAGKLQADITELELHNGTATAQVTAIMSEAVPRYAVRGKLENLDAAAVSTRLTGAPSISGRATLAFELTSTGYSTQEVIRRLSGKTSLALAEGGRVALDLKALRESAKSGAARSWTEIGKGQAAIEQFEARALIIDGVAFAESVQAKLAGTTLSASGRVGLDDGNMEVRLLVRQPSADAAAKSSPPEVVNMRGPWNAPVIRGEEADPFQR
jgi:AsmA protein